MSPSKVYFVSGASRGLGLGFIKQILTLDESAFVYAGVRDPGKCAELDSLGNIYPGRMKVVEYISGDVEGNATIAQEIKINHGRVDTIIANAGICNSMRGTVDITANEMNESFQVNVTGAIVLFQAMYQLLKKSSCPRFIPISSAGGCIDNALIELPVGMVSYGASKAALNWVTRKMHFDNEWLVVFPLSPGPVDTQMLHQNIEADTSGIFKKMSADIPSFPSPEETAKRLLKIINASSRETEGGQFVHVDGTRLAW